MRIHFISKVVTKLTKRRRLISRETRLPILTFLQPHYLQITIHKRHLNHATQEDLLLCGSLQFLSELTWSLLLNPRLISNLRKIDEPNILED
ncbi:hypothetical protein SULI_13340 [Saccharolobus solfataricus]|uniref:Uncharacterized protein n=1 Tax=Saccharolobus solfataricus TaxID=2287 RepID=A0A3G2Y102_SACSO|nr:hypothetical protein SULB_03830 [Saccharolobus solfataricus]AYN75791.1 hypothetical protein SULC_03815 [Saccharolobus solfataricus]AYP18625.1 hypothetical protein SULA_03820 [Saccharolobus solfataricus]AZF69184.1 hypothetical protein SULG_13340 [Saccharolobus solfataricus]AZF71804.1 hypothetical protein SULH_13340 [Saccharolobus solfataricus]